MMSTGTVTFLLYLLVMVDNFRSVSGTLVAISTVVFCTLLMISGIAAAETSRKFLESIWEKIAVVFFSIVIFFNVLVLAFVPDRNGAVLIVAGALGYEGVSNVIENERVQAIGGKSVGLLESWLDQQIEKINAERAELETQTEGEN